MQRERLSIRLRPSPQIAAGLAATHTLSLAGAWLAPIPTSASVALTAVILVHLFARLPDLAWRSRPASVAELEWLDGDEVSMQLRRGDAIEGRVHAGSFVSEHLIVLRCTQGERRRSRTILIAPDSLEREDFRRLRVWLRWSRPEPKPSTPP